MTFRQFAYRNVVRNSRIYGAFFMASFFSVAVFFIYSMLMFHPDIERGILGEVSLIGMVGAEIVLVLFTLFFLYYSMSAFLEARSHEFAILLHLGMEKRQMNKLVFLETMIIGAGSIIVGIVFGFSFSKFFFMIVREILHLDELPLYVSWQPFLLTIGVFTSAFVVISFISVYFTRERKLRDLIKGSDYLNSLTTYSKIRAVYGIALILGTYILAFVVGHTSLIGLTLLIPFSATFGTYYFFSDSVPCFLDLARGKRKFHWQRYRLLSLAEQTHIMMDNVKMFFVVTMVSTLAFLSVGVLATMSSYTTQYDRLNPLGLVYKGDIDNPYEREHINSLRLQLEEKGLSYQLSRFVVIKQTSSFTQNEVEVFRESDMNVLLSSYSYPLLDLGSGEAVFIPYSEDSLKKLKNRVVHTVLEENSIPITIDSVYPKIVFPGSIVSVNSIVISDEDFAKLIHPISEKNLIQPSYHLFTFVIPQWMETKEVGKDIDYLESNLYFLKKDKFSPFYFENAGLNYSYILATYSLFTLVGVLVATVFLLAAGSFIYFKLHTSLEREKRKFDVLKRMGLTDIELKKLVNRHLFPQFFLPWGVAMMHSAFAFLMVQGILKDIANISIVKEVFFAFGFFVLIQVVYFYLIRWRYISHIRS
ncbi:FtsX-like permease family protein [Lysinibacillus sp. fkY74-1]|uniref:ABC transporter permease n=3 Tax=Lysinibacillus TaxID=400634 RepID=W7RF41_LYSSH|nr:MULTISPECIES: ABC transporter permease [Lysinibacillus]MBE5084320.1 ABC transporter permease [Bacillus thuringiensis]MBG9727205.1 ABC transporter permease [Lysinibacillus fusiformis]AMO32224.1 ABC transporter permease [Lysinibacillus sphaericus]AMR92677.1 ABC transporter permease [Lysinibacillus sphaericus]ANA46726.1 ABC transporter permease [Lysinibacillus sphaericus]